MFSYWGTTEPKKQKNLIVTTPVIMTSPPPIPETTEEEVEHDEIEAVRSAPIGEDDSVHAEEDGDLVVLLSNLGEKDSVVGLMASPQSQHGYSMSGEESQTPSDKAAVGSPSKDVEGTETEENDSEAHQEQVLSAEEGDIDLDFVEQFDDAFNEYVSRNPDFLIANPDLVHNLRVTKLQLLLERQDALEAEMLQHYEQVKKEKALMEIQYQQSLKDAARMKAAREIHLQSHLKEINSSTKAMNAQLNWELVISSESRAKKQAQLLLDLQSQQSSVGTSRQDLLKALPEGPDLDVIRDAILAPPATGDTSTSRELSEQQKKDLRQFEMDNAFLQAEVTVLQKKLAYQKIGAKKNAWVESVLVRMDDKTLKKLKNRYQKKVGILL